MVSPLGLILYHAVTFGISFSFVFSLTPTKYRLMKTSVIALGPSLLITGIGFVWINLYSELKSINFLVIFVFKYTLFTVFCLVFISFRNIKTLFIILMSTNIVIPGYVAGILILFIAESECAFLLSSGFINAFVLILLVTYFKRNNADYNRMTQASWLKLCFVPLSFVVLVQSIFPLESISSFDLRILPAAIAVVTIIFTSYTLMGCYLRSSASNAILQAQQASMSDLERCLQQESKLANDAYSKIVRFRHDMPHFINMIQGAIHEGRLDEVVTILKNLPIPDTKNIIVRVCNDSFLNGVLAVAQHKARQVNVDLCIHIIMPHDLNISRVEFAAAVGNLADNAITAASKTSLRKVSLKIKTVNNNVVVRIDNSFETTLFLDPVSGLPLSKKEGFHGWGLVNVDNFAKKNKGMLDFQHKDQTVTALLLIPFKNGSGFP